MPYEDDPLGSALGATYFLLHHLVQLKLCVLPWRKICEDGRYHLTSTEEVSTTFVAKCFYPAYASRFFSKAYNLAKSGQLLIKTFLLPTF